MFSLNHPCGHTFPKTCYNIDDDDGGLEHHKCQEPCVRTCKFGHPCLNKCHEPCPPCVAKVVKTFPCTYFQTVMCCRDPNKECHCSTMVIKEFSIFKHEIELERCQQECGMILDCEHICTAKCLKRTSHDKVDCRQPCSRSLLPEKHPCPKKCFQECGLCQYDVINTLPCSQKMEIKCCVPTKDAYCSAKITRMLDNCEHSVTMDCRASTKGYKCTELSNRPLCLNNQLCQKLYWELCGPCYVQVEKQLPGGDFTKMECVRDPLKVRCRVSKEVILKDCGHRAQVDCGVVESDWVYCDYPCEVRLNCGHQCPLKCHMRDDPDHAYYRCEKLCGRSEVNCKREHKCNKKCYEKCDRCRMKKVRGLPCGHTVLTECGIDDKNVFCERDVMKTIPGCGHLQKFSCSTNVEVKSCNQLFNRQLICGHQCKKTGSEECNEKDCMVIVPIHAMSFCGHPIVKICSEVRRDPRANYVTDSMKKIQVLPNCPQSFGSLLACEHPCKENCWSCFNGRIHKSCEVIYGQILVCGLSYKVNCASSCPPRQERCQYHYERRRCNKKCGDPCEKCIEPCKWSCKLYKCTQKCSDPCDRPRCDDPCEKRLHCGHSCIGLCGEKCPPLCRVCDGEKLTEFILSGEEERENSRFVYLKNCGHSIEVVGLDRWMDVKEDEGTNVEILMKCCLRCKILIRSIYRYGDNQEEPVRYPARQRATPRSPLQFSILDVPPLPQRFQLNAFNMGLKPELNDLSFTRSLDQYLTDLQKNVFHNSGVDVGSFPAKNQ